MDFSPSGVRELCNDITNDHSRGLLITSPLEGKEEGIEASKGPSSGNFIKASALGASEGTNLHFNPISQR